MSDIPTPRTDAFSCSLNEIVRSFTNAAMPTQVIVDGMELVSADFARQLERELAAANAREARLREALTALANAVTEESSAANSISGNMGARLYDARDALAAADRSTSGTPSSTPSP